MSFVEHDEVVEAFPADGADEAFGEGILPGSARGDETLRMAMSAIRHVNSSP